MTTRDAIRDALKSARDEQDQLARQIEALDEVIRSLENAEKSLSDGPSGARRSSKSGSTRKATGTGSEGRSPAKKRTTAKKRTSSRGKKVSADQLIAAVTDLGGTATTDQVKQRLGITDGRLIAGARTQAVTQNRLTVDGGILRLTDTNTKDRPKGASRTTASKATSTGG